jgi:hypothetical protein
MTTRSILITNRRLENFGGSELVALELAEEFKAQGYDVLLYSPYIGDPMKRVIKVPYTTELPKTDDFDTLWIHHNILIHKLGFKKRAGQKIIFNHMSSYVSAEWPQNVQYENDLADLIFANSAETRVKLEDLGLKGVRLFQNPAPKIFEGVGGSGSEILLVSNHRPPELANIVGNRVGLEYPRRMTPEIMSQAKLVICNGKTVQMALRAGVPVYLYDHFGGPGWLTEKNFEKAVHFNFSGRGFDGWKTLEQIQKELETIGPVLPCPDRFKLEKVLEFYKLI